MDRFLSGPMLLLLLLVTGCRYVIVEGVGRVPWTQICRGDDCGVAGGEFQALDLGANGRSVLNLGSVAEILGATIDPRNIKSLPRTCEGVNLTPNDWQSNILARTNLAAAERTAGSIKSTLRSALANELARRGLTIDAALDAELDAVAESAATELRKVQNTYYYLKEEARQRVRARCGPDSTERRLVISAAMIEMSAQSKVSTTETLAAGIRANIGLAGRLNSVAGLAGATAVDAIAQSVSETTTQTLVDRQLFPIVVGYDKPETGALPAVDDRAVLRCLAENKPTFDCGMATFEAAGQYAVAIAQVPREKLLLGYTLAGGGCRMRDYSEQPGDHNAILAQSAPEGNAAWRCKLADPPGIPVNRPVTSYVIFCKVIAPNCLMQHSSTASVSTTP